MKRKIGSRGYAWIRVDGKWVSEHRYLMEQQLGRELVEGHEEVHHKNGVKDDNRLENLEVLTHAEHMKKHARAKNRRCRYCGTPLKLYQYRCPVEECNGFKPLKIKSARELFS